MKTPKTMKGRSQGETKSDAGNAEGDGARQ